MTYRQALEAFRTHCDFVPRRRARNLILGANLAGLLERARPINATEEPS